MKRKHICLYCGDHISEGWFCGVRCESFYRFLYRVSNEKPKDVKRGE